MGFPVRITFRNMPHSISIEASVREQARALETFCPDILGCRVVVSMPHRHHERGNRCHVELDITLPGEQVVVNHEPSTHGTLRDVAESEHAKHTEPDGDGDAYLTVHHTFEAARRQIQDRVRRRRGDVKSHAAQ
jgi:ribosome-associated translation inhibitor RaiA